VWPACDLPSSGSLLKQVAPVALGTSVVRPTTRPSRRWGRFPTTADVGIWATGSTPNALLEGLGLGLFALMTNLRRVRPREERAVSASGSDPPSLVVAYLSELLLLQQRDGFIAREIEVRPIGDPPTALVASLRGEPFEQGRHVPGIEVKAVTFHELELDLTRGRARVIVDI
jgi:SHS2 domain-containing protein